MYNSDLCSNVVPEVQCCTGVPRKRQDTVQTLSTRLGNGVAGESSAPELPVSPREYFPETLLRAQPRPFRTFESKISTAMPATHAVEKHPVSGPTFADEDFQPKPTQARHLHASFQHPPNAAVTAFIPRARVAALRYDRVAESTRSVTEKCQIISGGERIHNQPS